MITYYSKSLVSIVVQQLNQHVLQIRRKRLLTANLNRYELNRKFMSAQFYFDKMSHGGSEIDFWNAFLDSEVKLNIATHENPNAFAPLVVTEPDGNTPTVLVFTEHAQPMVSEGHNLVSIYASELVGILHPALSITVKMQSGAIVGSRKLLAAIRESS